MIVVTGAIGFIGSAFVGYLNQLGYADIVVVDDFYQWKKEKNLKGKRVHDWVHRDLFIAYFEKIAGAAINTFGQICNLPARSNPGVCYPPALNVRSRLRALGFPLLWCYQCCLFAGTRP